MGLFAFSCFTDPIFYKKDSDAERRLVVLKELRPLATGDTAKDIDKEIRLVEAGIAGEN